MWNAESHRKEQNWTFIIVNEGLITEPVLNSTKQCESHQSNRTGAKESGS